MQFVLPQVTNFQYFSTTCPKDKIHLEYGQHCNTRHYFDILLSLVWGWSGGARALGKLLAPGRPTIWITVGQGPTALAVGAEGGCLDIFTLVYPFSPLSSSLWETARYRLKYCLKGPLNPKPTNQPIPRVRLCIL